MKIILKIQIKFVWLIFCWWLLKWDNISYNLAIQSPAKKFSINDNCVKCVDQSQSIINVVLIKILSDNPLT